MKFLVNHDFNVRVKSHSLKHIYTSPFMTQECVRCVQQGLNNLVSVRTQTYAQCDTVKHEEVFV